MVDQHTSDQLARPACDGRDIALTHQSVRILRSLGVWARIDPAERPAIRMARVEDGMSPYFLEFAPPGDEVDDLGYIVPNHIIRRVLYEKVQDLTNVKLHPGTAVSDVSSHHEHGTIILNDGRTLKSRLIVAADGRFSESRRNMGIAASMHDFGRVCIVCRVENEKPHNGIAFECFHYGRTLAVLPLGENTCSVVITAPMHQRDAIMAMGEEHFNHDLQWRFNGRMGAMHLNGERFAYPLVGVHAKRFYATRFALIGDAAVGMHPVTAHGFNLGLGGAEILAGEIAHARARGSDIGATQVLSRYQKRHMRKTMPIYYGTNEIVRLFTDDRLPAKIARQAVLRLTNNLPPLKRAIRHLLTEPRARIRLLPSLRT